MAILGSARADVSIRAPRDSDAPAFLEAVRRSRELHRPWVYPPDNLASYAAWLQHVSKPNNKSHVLVSPADGSLVGVINANEIVLGALCSTYLGYYAFDPWAGKGLMRAGMRLVLAELFGDVGLHRVEANIQPGNRASIALVESLGFRKEGYSPRYLKIGGDWRDHERWALIADDWRR